VLKFSLAFEVDGTGVDRKYEGAPRSDVITGEVAFQIGSTSPTAEFTGKLTPPTDAK
jgi:hypothetical protein